MADPSLTSLCNICHSAAPKYTCPRDKVRTCSLACAQAHKRRAACNGQRDPSAYVSKSALTTAGGIDRDYNFLSGLERGIDRADKETQERGVSLSGHGNAGFQKRWHDNGALSKYLKSNGIVVHRAPVGMARQKANETRFIQKSKRIVWSVEWVVEGEKKVVEVDESRTVGQAYGDLLKEKERESKKRKRGPEETQAKAQKTKAQPEPTKEATLKTNLGEDGTVGEQAPVRLETSTSEALQLEEPLAQPAEKDHATEEGPAAATAPDQETPHFYLHKPHTSSKSTVLIPIEANLTLTSALTQKAVLEFPSIYVFSNQGSEEQARPALPQGYITDEEYVREKTDEDEELGALMEKLPEAQRKVALNGGIFGAEGTNEEEQWDEGKVLEVLQRDVDALKK